MVTSAPAWASNQNVWAVAGAVLGFIGALIGARAAWRTAHPRMRLHIVKRTPEAILPRSHSWGDFTISRQGQTYTRLAVVTIEVINAGNKDVLIPADGALRLRFGHPILHVLGIGAKPSGRAAPEVTAHERELQFQQGLLPSRHTVTVSVVADEFAGGPIEIRSALPDVQIIRKYPRRRPWRGIFKYLVIPVLIFTAGAWFGSS